MQHAKVASNEAVPPNRSRSSSYKAVQYALSSLYALDDFNKQFLARGFYSKIYKVTHKQTGEVFVLKLNTRTENRVNMLHEVQLMNKLHHANILRYIGACVHQGQLHALTEYIKGGSLEELIANKTSSLSWNRRVSLSRDIAAGMYYLHSNGIMHRDLTSKNILIDSPSLSDHCANTKAVICDLGLAAKIPDCRRKLCIVGSPWWMAPECIHGQIYDEKADVFSFGIIMCEITSGLPADPDFLPRTQNFGLDYVAFSHLVHDCPLAYLKLAFICCQIDDRNRPSFEMILSKFNCLSSHSEMANLLQEYCNQSSNITDSKTKPSALYIGMGLKRNHSQHQLQFNYQLSKSEDCRPQNNTNDNQNKNSNNNNINNNNNQHPQCKLSTSKSNALPLNNMDEITPSMIGVQMSLTDQYYQPCRNNPFVKKFEDLGATKILDANSINHISHEKKRCNSLPTSPLVHPWSGHYRHHHHGSEVSDSDASCFTGSSSSGGSCTSYTASCGGEEGGGGGEAGGAGGDADLFNSELCDLCDSVYSSDSSCLESPCALHGDYYWSSCGSAGGGSCGRASGGSGGRASGGSCGRASGGAGGRRWSGGGRASVCSNTAGCCCGTDGSGGGGGTCGRPSGCSGTYVGGGAGGAKSTTEVGWPHAMNDVALSCLSHKQKFRDTMTSWKRCSQTSSTSSSRLDSTNTSAAEAGQEQNLEVAFTGSLDQPKYLVHVQRMRNLWEERLLKLAANEAKRRDER